MTPRIAAIDWAMLETSVALGVMPVAATELFQFRSGAVEPDIPETVADLGLRGAPNFELLQLTRSELILISPFYTRYTGRLEAIAPVFSLPFYVKGEPPFEKALAAVTALGESSGGPKRRARFWVKRKRHCTPCGPVLPGFPHGRPMSST